MKVIILIISMCLVTLPSHGKEKVVAYMADHAQKGYAIVKKSEAQYYRVILKDLTKGQFLAQDFYISGKKMTDPYVIVNSQFQYVFNENTDDGRPIPRDGDRFVWYESGKKKADTHYQQKREDGLWLSWYENGQLESSTTYNVGKKNGKSQTWFENGKLSGLDNYKFGKLMGTSWRWNDEGVVTMQCEFLNDKQNGKCLYWYSNGNKMIEGYYINGNKRGNWIEWDQGGKVIVKEFYP